MSDTINSLQDLSRKLQPEEILKRIKIGTRQHMGQSLETENVKNARRENRVSDTHAHFTVGTTNLEYALLGVGKAVTAAFRDEGCEVSSEFTDNNTHMKVTAYDDDGRQYTATISPANAHYAKAFSVSINKESLSQVETIISNIYKEIKDQLGDDLKGCMETRYQDNSFMTKTLTDLSLDKFVEKIEKAFRAKRYDSASSIKDCAESTSGKDTAYIYAKDCNTALRQEKETDFGAIIEWDNKMLTSYHGKDEHSIYHMQIASWDDLMRRK